MNFFDEVYQLLKTIPYGKVTTYGDIDLVFLELSAMLCT